MRLEHRVVQSQVKMENAGFQSNEVIEMHQSNNHTKCIPFSSSSSSIPKNNNTDSQYYCDIDKCCSTKQNEIEGPWHNLKTTFLLIFLVGFLVWAVGYFCLLHNQII